MSFSDSSQKMHATHQNTPPMTIMRDEQKGKSNIICMDTSEQLHRNENVTEFEDLFKAQRSAMDYQYFGNYTLRRQQVQDEILLHMIGPNLWDQVLNAGNATPWVIYTAGVFGAGKSHVIRALKFDGTISFQAKYLHIDPDMIKFRLPEMETYLEENELTASARLHKESTFLALLLERWALSRRIPIIVDGSLQDATWYTSWFAQLQRTEHYKVMLIKVNVALDVAQARCESRARTTRRHIPLDLLVRTYEKCNLSFAQLANKVDLALEIDNTNSQHFIKKIYFNL